MISKSLIRFSVDGWSCLPSLLFTSGQTKVEVMKVMAFSFKRSQACTAILKCPQPCSRPPPTHASDRDSQTPTGKPEAVSCGVTAPFSWVLAHKILFVPSKSLFPQSCVSSDCPMVGLMATSSKRAYATPRSTAPRVPAPAAGYC